MSNKSAQDSGSRASQSRPSMGQRSVSMLYNAPSSMPWTQSRALLLRRMSSDQASMEKPMLREFIVEGDETLDRLRAQGDVDGEQQTSITDGGGPPSITLKTVHGGTAEVHGTYVIGSLLQELLIAQTRGDRCIRIAESRLAENPVDRLSRLIRTVFWDNLTRSMDADGLEQVLADPKNRSSYRGQILYVPSGAPDMIAYYRRVAQERPEMHLEVEVLPEKFTPEYVRKLNHRPGLVAIALDPVGKDADGRVDMRGIPFVVPGSRFNELYNWDSYFIALGLLEDGRLDLAKGPVDHFIFEIEHYNKIMNGNRTYYLLRSQPPFFTDFTRRVYTRLVQEEPSKAAEHKAWLHRALCAAVKEYRNVWMSEPRYDTNTGLSRYHPEGQGVPPETEPSHFTALLHPYAEKYRCSVNEFTRMYDERKVHEPELDEYFRHDRAVRESGHDTSYRVERRCADLAMIDLQALLYKYERDMGEMIRDEFGDALDIGECEPMHSAEWFERAAFRKQQVDKFCWNEGKGLYFDYDLRTGEQSLYESVTSFWTLWAGMASEAQARRMVHVSLRKFEATGGLVTGTEESRGPVSLARPNRQWDYPYAWPPHQMMAWEGLDKYGFVDDARRLAYRWLYMITTAFVNFNGIVPEKFDAVALSHLVHAEYGNQGTPREGFGWTNASFQVGLTYLPNSMRKSLAMCQHPDHLFHKSVLDA